MSDPAGPSDPWVEHLRPRLAGLRLAPAREAEIIEELSQHLDERYDELRAEGVGDADARRLVIEELRDRDALAAYMRPLRQANVPPPDTPGLHRRVTPAALWQDLRYAIRVLRRDRGFTAAAVLTLALGIGVNSAIFALVDATLLRPLPFAGADRLVMVWERSDTSSRGRVSPLNLMDWQSQNRSFETIGAFVPNVGGMVMSGADGMPDTIPRQWVTADFFTALGVRPIIGRTFVPDDDRQRRNVVVFTEGFWRARFNADPGIVGRELRLDGGLWTVAGVVPDEAQVFLRTSMWALYPLHGRSAGSRTLYALQAVGRLRPGVTVDAARSDMTAVADGLARALPATNANRGVTLEPLHDAVIGTELRRTSLLFVGVVAFVLLICCANVANLLLTRGTSRRRELAIRVALGADRSRIIRQLLTESLVVAAIGGALGIALGAALLRVAPSIVPQDLLSAAVSLAFNGRVVAFCATAAIFVGVVFGLVPAWQATAGPSTQALALDTRTTTGRGRRLREMLVIGEVMTAAIVLVGAGLLLRTMIAVENVDRGYAADSALTMIVDPAFGGVERLLQFYTDIEREANALPGVRSVAWATTLPLGRSYLGSTFAEIVGDPPLPAGRTPTADTQIVSASYFQTLGIPIVAGRGFDEDDTRQRSSVCMVNEGFVRRYLRGRSPIGLRVATRPVGNATATPVIREIVGVAGQVRNQLDETEDFVQLYIPLTQTLTGDIFLIARPESGRADVLAPAVRSVINRFDKEKTVSVRSILTLEDVAAQASARHRFRATLVAAFAALALALAMVGLFGILAYSVQQRMREFAVRRALGANTANVIRLIAGSVARVVGIGTILGLAASVWVGRLLATMLFGVQASDAVTFVSVLAVIAVTAGLAAAGPAWRATRVDPAVALRAE